MNAIKDYNNKLIKNLLRLFNLFDCLYKNILVIYRYNI